MHQKGPHSFLQSLPYPAETPARISVPFFQHRLVKKGDPMLRDARDMDTLVGSRASAPDRGTLNMKIICKIRLGGQNL